MEFGRKNEPYKFKGAPALQVVELLCVYIDGITHSSQL